MQEYSYILECIFVLVNLNKMLTFIYLLYTIRSFITHLDFSSIIITEYIINNIIIPQFVIKLISWYFV